MCGLRQCQIVPFQLLNDDLDSSDLSQISLCAPSLGHGEFDFIGAVFHGRQTQGSSGLVARFLQRATAEKV